MSDDDSDSMMRSMMGFSSFGTQRPAGRKISEAPPPTGSNAAPVTKKAKTLTISTENAKPSGIYAPSAPASVHQTEPDTSTVSSVSTMNITTAASFAPGATATSTTTFHSTTPVPPGHPIMQPPPRPSDGTNTTSAFARPTCKSTSGIAYVSPANPAYQLTNSERDLLRNGKPNDRGDTVFFQPSFIDENPWKALQDMASEERDVRNEG